MPNNFLKQMKRREQPKTKQLKGHWLESQKLDDSNISIAFILGKSDPCTTAEALKCDSALERMC